MANGKKVLLLTKREVILDENKKIYINKNPFQDDDYIFDEDMILEIIQSYWYNLFAIV